MKISIKYLIFSIVFVTVSCQSRDTTSYVDAESLAWDAKISRGVFERSYSSSNGEHFYGICDKLAKNGELDCAFYAWSLNGTFIQCNIPVESDTELLLSSVERLGKQRFIVQWQKIKQQDSTGVKIAVITQQNCQLIRTFDVRRTEELKNPVIVHKDGTFDIIQSRYKESYTYEAEPYEGFNLPIELLDDMHIDTVAKDLYVRGKDKKTKEYKLKYITYSRSTDDLSIDTAALETVSWSSKKYSTEGYVVCANLHRTIAQTEVHCNLYGRNGNLDATYKIEFTEAVQLIGVRYHSTEVVLLTRKFYCFNLDCPNDMTLTRALSSGYTETKRQKFECTGDLVDSMVWSLVYDSHTGKYTVSYVCENVKSGLTLFRVNDFSWVLKRYFAIV